jgi:predicted enzyme related to lactoylglutathione lyase
MAKVKGIGGAFIQSEDPKRLAAWYTEVLGIQLSPQSDDEGQGFYHVFETRDAESGILRANPVFAIQKSEEKISGHARSFVLNLRVDDLAVFLTALRARGVQCGDLVEHPYGLFSSTNDLDGNRIELYEERFPDAELRSQS